MVSHVDRFLNPPLQSPVGHHTSRWKHIRPKAIDDIIVDCLGLAPAKPGMPVYVVNGRSCRDPCYRMGHPLGRQFPLVASIGIRAYRRHEGLGWSGKGRARGRMGWLACFWGLAGFGSLSEARRYNAGSRWAANPGLYWVVWGGLPRLGFAWLSLYWLCFV